MRKIIIVGGVAAGASTATRLRRLDENAQIIMFERGEHISFANCGLPYYISGTIPARDDLIVQTPENMEKRFNLDIRVLSEVREILRDEKKVRVTDLGTGESYLESYDYLVLCPGAKPYVPEIPGIDMENVFRVRNIPDSDKIKDYIKSEKVKKATVLGGGFIGMEMLDILVDLEIQTILIEAGAQVVNGLDLEMSKIIHNYLGIRNVELILNDKAIALEGHSRAEEVILASGETIPTELVILGAGVKPEVWLAEEAGLTIGTTGGIWVDDNLKTSDPYIYAAGDAVQIKDFVTGADTLVPMAGPANRQGWIIANNIAGRDIKYKGSQCTGILRVLGLTVAYTGKNEKDLRKLGINYLACHLHPPSHARYYPGSTEMTVKLLFTPDEGKVLGAQIVGYDGVDKRIDVLATCIRAGLNVFDIQELELAYAPPFSSAKGPVNMAAYVAGNMLNGDVSVVHWTDVPNLVARGAHIIDVRDGEQTEEGRVPGAQYIHLDELRSRLDEIPKDKEILVYCRAGQRSYIANRILLQNGFKVKNISGGYKSYSNL